MYFSPSRPGPNFRKAVILIYAMAGCVFLFSSLYSSLQNLLFLRQAQSAEGRVVEMKKMQTLSWRHRPRVFYKPIIEFDTLDHHKITFQGILSDAYYIGEPLEILYPPEDPEKAKINAPLELWVREVSGGILGIMFLSLALVFWRFRNPSMIQRTSSEGLR
jgi:hypothetical protein